MTGAGPPVPAVDGATVRASPLRDRVVLLVDRSGEGAGLRLLDALSQRPDVARAGASGLFAHGLPRAYGNHHLTTDAGIGLLAPLPVLTAAARALVDELLLAGTGSRPGSVVELVPDEPTPRALARALYPDATVVVVGGEPDADARTHLDADAVRRSPADAAASVAASVPPSSRSTAAPDPGPDRLRDRLVVVFGVPRSGTTWLEELLLAHPAAGGLPAGESWLFRAVQGFWQNLEGGAGLQDLVGRADLAGALRRFCDRLLTHRLDASPGATHFVEKTPANAWLLPWINAVYPDAWYVHVVRDGRDVSRSAAEMVHGTADVRRAAANWAATLQEVDRRRWMLARSREVRYEDLLADPVGRASDLLAWAGLPATAAATAAVRDAAGVRVSRHGTTGPVGAGKWTSMTTADRRIVLATAGDELVGRGYATGADVEAARRALRRPAGALAEVRRRARLRAALTSRPPAPASSA